MNPLQRLVARWCRALWLSILGTAAYANTGVPTPEVRWTDDSTYQLSYPSCAYCYGDGIELRSESDGSWSYVGSGTTVFSEQPAGTYRYRVVYMTEVLPGYFQPVYGAAVRVVVDAIAGPGSPALKDQLAITYRAFRGDLDLDGQNELLLRPAAEDGQAGASRDALVLRQAGGGELSVSPASQSVLTIASGWPLADVEIGLRDVNIDGQVDLVLREIGRVPGFAGVANAIVLTADDPNDTEVIAADSRLTRFSRDINRHLVDPDYYPNNAPYAYAAIVYYTTACYYPAQYSWIDGGFPRFCYVQPNLQYVVYQDFSVFDDNAMEIASFDYGMIHGVISADTGLDRIQRVLERVLGAPLGGWDINELMTPDTAVTDQREQRSLGLFAVLAGISEAVAQEPGSQSGPPADERVLLKGRRVLGYGPMHTVLEFRNKTVSAYDSDSRALFDGRLVSEVNWPRDHPSLTIRLGYVDGPAQASVYWASVLTADSRYDDDLPYDLFPSIGQDGYNSNGFISGLIAATLGRPTISLEAFVGAEWPVPPGAFY